MVRIKVPPSTTKDGKTVALPMTAEEEAVLALQHRRMGFQEGDRPSLDEQFAAAEEVIARGGNLHFSEDEIAAVVEERSQGEEVDVVDSVSASRATMQSVLKDRFSALVAQGVSPNLAAAQVLNQLQSEAAAGDKNDNSTEDAGASKVTTHPEGRCVPEDERKTMSAPILLDAKREATEQRIKAERGAEAFNLNPANTSSAPMADQQRLNRMPPAPVQADASTIPCGSCGNDVSNLSALNPPSCGCFGDNGVCKDCESKFVHSAVDDQYYCSLKCCNADAEDTGWFTGADGIAHKYIDQAAMEGTVTGEPGKVGGAAAEHGKEPAAKRQRCNP